MGNIASLHARTEGGQGVALQRMRALHPYEEFEPPDVWVRQRSIARRLFALLRVTPEAGGHLSQPGGKGLPCADFRPGHKAQAHDDR